jgi:hypothetical protein
LVEPDVPATTQERQKLVGCCRFQRHPPPSRDRRLNCRSECRIVPSRLAVRSQIARRGDRPSLGQSRRSASEHPSVDSDAQRFIGKMDIDRRDRPRRCRPSVHARDIGNDQQEDGAPELQEISESGGLNVDHVVAGAFCANRNASACSSATLRRSPRSMSPSSILRSSNACSGFSGKLASDKR